MSATKSLIPILSFLALCGIAQSQCPVNTVLLKGRVENANANEKVRVQLIYPKKRPGESGEVTVENGTFQIPIEFVTMKSSIFSNLPKRCGRKPQSVVITLLSNDQETDRAFLDFEKDFKFADPSAYTLRSELVLKATR